MADDGAGVADPLLRLPSRIGNVVELLTTLDTRLLNALDALENMQRSVSAFDPVSADADRLVEDTQRRLAALDDRLNRDLDELKGAILAKLAELDLAGFGERFDRIETAVFNIERATLSLDQSFEGALELLPDFMTRKLKAEGKRVAPQPAGDGRDPR